MMSDTIYKEKRYFAEDNIEANVRAKMLIYLLENNLIEKEK